MVVLITLETKVGDVEGMMNFCIPYITIEPIISKLSAQYWYSSIRKGTTTENMEIIRKRLEVVTLPVIVELGNLDITMREVLGLKKGNIVNLIYTKVSNEMDVKITDKMKFKARPGIVGPKKAIQITKVVEEFSDELLEEIKKGGEEE